MKTIKTQNNHNTILFGALALSFGLIACDGDDSSGSTTPDDGDAAVSGPDAGGGATTPPDESDATAPPVDEDATAPAPDADVQGDAGPACFALTPEDVCPADAGMVVDAGGDAGMEALALSGMYTDNFDGEWDISSCAINGEAVLSYDNEVGWAVVQNSCDATFNPGQFSRYDFAWLEGDAGVQLYVCTSVFNAASEEEAIAADRADESSLDEGCGGFSWSIFTPAE